MEDKQAKPGRRGLLITIGVLLAVVSTLPWLLWREEIRQFAELGYLGLFVACFLGTAVVLMPSSTTLLIVMASVVLNPALCILVGTLGAVLGEMISYFCGTLGANALSGESRLRALIERLARRPEVLVFLFAVVPLPVFDLAGLTAGVKKMPWWRYALCVFLGRVIKYIVAVVASLALLPWLAWQTDGLVRGLIELLMDMIGLPVAPA